MSEADLKMKMIDLAEGALQDAEDWDSEDLQYYLWDNIGTYIKDYKNYDYRAVAKKVAENFLG